MNDMHTSRQYFQFKFFFLSLSSKRQMVAEWLLKMLCLFGFFYCCYRNFRCGYDLSDFVFIVCNKKKHFLQHSSNCFFVVILFTFMRMCIITIFQLASCHQTNNGILLICLNLKLKKN